MDINSFIIGFKKGKQSGGGSDLAKYLEEQHEEVILPGVTKIKPYAFYKDAVVKTVSMPDATEIGNYAFAYTSDSTGGSVLASVSMPKVTSIGPYAFNYCKNLKTIDLPEGLTYIGLSAFYACGSLASVTLPSTLETMGGMAFLGCANLKTVTFLGKPNSMSQSMPYMMPFSAAVEVINVPWSEGEVAGAPWGATSATINYNYTGG